MKKYVIISGLILISNILLSQIKPAGTWTAYLSNSRGVQTVLQDQTFFTITEGGMYSFDSENDEIRTFSSVEGMSSINPTTIFYAEESGLTFIGYEDGMINYFSEPGSYQYSTEIQRNDFYTQKRINAFTAQGNRLFVATDFGLVIYNMDTQLPITDITQFGDNPNQLKVTSVAIFQESIYVLIPNVGIYSAPLDFPNLKDPGIWTSEDFSPGFPADKNAYEIGANAKNLYMLSDTSVYIKDGVNWGIFDRFNGGNWTRIFVWDDAVGVSANTRTLVIYDDNSETDFITAGPIRDIEYVAKDVFYVTTGFSGSRLYNNGSSKIIAPSGPRNNECIRLGSGNGELYIAPKGYDQAFGPTKSAQGIYYYTKETDWVVIDSASKKLHPSVSTGFARVFYDDETSNAYVASFGSGIVTLNNGDQLDYFNCENAGLSTINDFCNLDNRENSRVSGMGLDAFNNLWITLDFAQDPLMVQSAETGEWFKAATEKLPNNDHFIDMVVDEYGSKWILNAEQGVIVYNDNNTPFNFSDDRVLNLRSGLNQGNLPSNEVYSLAIDDDGFVWVGTGQGIVFFDPFSIAQGVITDAFTPAYERRPLLKDAIINAIAVDGGNRKWIATNDGVFLVSEDGDDVIHAFTTENSPLLSNSVNDVSVDNQTGEVFFATSLGVISYQGDATAGASRCNDVFVYPNPAFTDQENGITIKGSSAESTVKITTVSGLLVRELQSQGGTTIWDGRDVYGNKVRSGVYLALIADREGENACIGKFTVIAR